MIDDALGPAIYASNENERPRGVHVGESRHGSTRLPGGPMRPRSFYGDDVHKTLPLASFHMTFIFENDPEYELVVPPKMGSNA